MPDDEHGDDGTDRGDDFSQDDSDDEGSLSGARTPSEVGPDTTVSRDDEDAPLSGLREDVERRRETEDDDFEELFTEMGVEGVEDSSDEVWSELSESPGTPSVDPGSTVTDSETASDPLDDGREVTVVEKRLCHNCPHFADPPETACTHEGTTIDAEVDVDHFRVVDCPVVAAREDVETSDFSADES